MNPSNAAGIGAIMALAAAVQPWGGIPHKTITQENHKRRDKAERNKRKQQKASRRRNR